MKHQICLGINIHLQKKTMCEQKGQGPQICLQRTTTRSRKFSTSWLERRLVEYLSAIAVLQFRCSSRHIIIISIISITITITIIIITIITTTISQLFLVSPSLHSP